MRTTSQTWKNIVANGEFDMESVARIYGATGNDPNGVAGSDSRGSYKEYGTITAPTITRSLLSGDALSVGNAIAGQLKFTIMTTDTIPKSAMITIRARVKNRIRSDWLEFGTFWLDHRTVTENLTDIEAYDAMKKGNQTYADNSQALVWPKSIGRVVSRIAEQMGVAIDIRTTIDILGNTDIANLDIVTKPTDDMSLLDILGNIGGILGGNWIITDENRLRFVPLASPIEIKGYILDSEENIIAANEGNRLLWHGESEEDTEDTDTIDAIDIPVVISTLNTASKYTVSKVTIGYDSEHVYSVGNDTGYEIIQSNNPYASQAMAELLYSRINGITYAPFESTGCIYNPAVEMGDGVVIGTDISSILYKETRTFDIGFSANISAPGRDEMEDEYPFQTFAQKTQYQIEGVNKDLSVVRSEIQQLPDSILLRVSQTYETQEDAAENYSDLNVSLGQISAEVGTKVGNSEVRSKFALDKQDIIIQAGIDEHGDATGKITFDSGTIEINSTNFTLDSTGHIWCSGASIDGGIIENTNTYSWGQAKLSIGSAEISYKSSNVEYATIGLGQLTKVVDDELKKKKVFNLWTYDCDISIDHFANRSSSASDMSISFNSFENKYGKSIEFSSRSFIFDDGGATANIFKLNTQTVEMNSVTSIKINNNTCYTGYGISIGDKTIDIVNGLITSIR